MCSSLWVRWKGFFGFACCLVLGGGTGTAGGNIQEQGKSFSQKSPLIVATAADSPRFSYVDTTSRPAGDLVGFEVALIKDVAHVLGREVVFKNMDFGAIILCVLSGQASIAIAQFEVTLKELKNIDFSEPYCVARLMLLSLTSTPVRLPVSWKNKMIGVQLGSRTILIPRASWLPMSLPSSWWFIIGSEKWYKI